MPRRASRAAIWKTLATKKAGVGLFVQPYRATGAKYQLAEAIHPIWRSDGEILAVTAPAPGVLSVMNVTESRASPLPSRPNGPCAA